MPAPSKKTAKRIGRMLELHALGSSAREIGEDICVDVATVTRWLKDKGLAANGGAGPRKDRKRVPGATSAPRSAILAAAAVLAEAEAPAGEGEGGEADGEPLDVVRARRKLVTRVLNDLADPVKLGDYDPVKWSALARLEKDLAAAEAELTPPAPVDPERDPANLEAAAAVRAKLDGLIGHYEKHSRCVNCGQPPFATPQPPRMGPRHDP